MLNNFSYLSKFEEHSGFTIAGNAGLIQEDGLVSTKSNTTKDSRVLHSIRDNSAAARGGGKQNTRAMCPKMLPRVKILQLRGVLLQQGLQQVHFGYEVRRMGRLDTIIIIISEVFYSVKERYLPTLDGIGREERRCSVELLQLERTKQHKTMQCGRPHHESNEGRTEPTLKALKK